MFISSVVFLLIARTHFITPFEIDECVAKARLLVQQMTLDEKIVMVHGGQSEGWVGYIPGNDRLGIPALTINDAGNGFRDNNHPGSTTCWPSALAAGSTWDLDRIQKLGEYMAQEFYDKGSNVLLGPGVNLARVPLNGRTFEYMSGGDPFLGYTVIYLTNSHSACTNM